MKVLFLSPSASLGGAEQVLLTTTAMLRRHDPTIDIAVLTLGEGPLLEALQQQNISVQSLPIAASVERLGEISNGIVGRLRWMAKAIFAIPGLWRLRRDFRRAIAAEQPNIVHSNGIKTHLLARFSGTGRTPVIWHVHDFYGSRPLARRLLAWASGGMTEAVAISKAVANDFIAAVGAKPISLIHNGVDLERFRPGRPRTELLDCQSGPASEGTIRVGMVATYARWKGHNVYLRAAAEILRILPGFPLRFYLVGGPIYRTTGSQYREEEFRTLIGELGISEKMQLICFQRESEQVYSNLDIVVHASVKPEPFGLTIVEAMASGCSVIASYAGGVAEIIEDGKDGLAVIPGDVESLARALERLIRDPKLRCELGKNARDKVERLFDRNRMGGQLREMYQRLSQRETAPFSSFAS